MVYARLARPTGSRLELVLTKLLRGDALVYATGLSAIHAYLVRLGPKKSQSVEAIMGLMLFSTYIIA